ncbi:MAG: phosphodiesterase [Paracoccaceae bacterium]
MKFVHVTDLHLTPPGELLLGIDPLERARLVFADIARMAPDAAAIVITGDLSQNGDAAAYHALKELLEGAAAAPVKLMLGNHDDRATFRAAFPERPVDAHGFVQWAEDVPIGRFVYMDTHEPDSAAGSYCPRRQAWLAETLERAAGDGRAVYLFMHHPPFTVLSPRMDEARLRDGDRVYEIIKGSGAEIRHIFLGHLHRPISGAWHGIPYTVQNSIVFQATEALEGSDVVMREGPATYAIVHLLEDRTVIHTHDFLYRYHAISY